MIPTRSPLAALAGACAALALTAGAALADFRGGGVVFAFTETCAQQGWPVGSVLAARVRHAPSELYGDPSQITIAFANGTQHYAIWETFAATTQNFNGLGRRVWTDFLLHPNRPRLRPVQRRILERVNPALPESMPNAREVFLRLRIENFDNLPGCSATVAAQLRRF